MVDWEQQDWNLGLLASHQRGPGLLFYLQGPSVGKRGGEGKRVVGVRIVGAGMKKGGDLIPEGSCQEPWSH